MRTSTIPCWTNGSWNGSNIGRQVTGIRIVLVSGRSLAGERERRSAMLDDERRAPDALDAINPEEWNAAHDITERARAERRAERARARAAQPPKHAQAPHTVGAGPPPAPPPRALPRPPPSRLRAP